MRLFRIYQPHLDLDKKWYVAKGVKLTKLNSYSNVTNPYKDPWTFNKAEANTMTKLEVDLQMYYRSYYLNQVEEVENE